MHDTWQPDVTVVIPAYRAEAFVPRAIHSVLDQPGVDPQIIVVVDGVFDRTAEVAVAFPKTTVLINETNRGAPAARNRGLAEARAAYVTFLDADDWVEGGFYRGLLSVAREQSADLVFGKGCWQSADGLRTPILRSEDVDNLGILKAWMNGCFVPNMGLLWRREFVRGLGGWREDLARNQDGEIAWRALLNGARVGRSSSGCGIYFRHESPTRVTARRDEEGQRSVLRIADWLIGELEARDRLQGSMREAVLGHLYGEMRESYLRGLDSVAQQFEERWRRLGGRRHQGSITHRLMCSLIGLKRKQRLANMKTTILARLSAKSATPAASSHF